MATIISRRKLQPGEFEGWEERFAAAAPARAAAGCRGVRRFRNPNDPDEIFVIFDWSSLDAARAFIAGNVRQIQQRDPNAPPPAIETWYVDELEPLPS